MSPVYSVHMYTYEQSDHRILRLGMRLVCTRESHTINHCMNGEPLVLPGTCGLFLGTGGAGPRALRFSAVPGKGACI